LKKYIYELPDLLDTDYIFEKSMKVITTEWLETPAPYALGKYTDNPDYYINVKNDKYLESIRLKYPKLKDYIKILKSENGTWHAHIDKWRKTEINIPLKHYDDCQTHFYKEYTELEEVDSTFGSATGTWTSNKYVSYVETKDVIFSHKLVVPTLLNTAEPHSITNNSTQVRIIASWTYDDNYMTAIEELRHGH